MGQSRKIAVDLASINDSADQLRSHLRSDGDPAATTNLGEITASAQAVLVDYAPTDVGDDSGALTLASDDPDENPTIERIFESCMALDAFGRAQPDRQPDAE
ncbi:MAG: hypothetical protein ACTSXZ_01805 [Alphaproteobacteria bacterium]